jgi:hypothetical protein
MISTDVRLRLENIAKRIRQSEEVSLTEMQWAQKWADHNRSAASILSKARRVAVQGEAESGTLDELLQGLDLGSADPSDHLVGPQSPDALADFFKKRDGEDWLRND